MAVTVPSAVTDRLRRMVNEPTAAVYATTDLESYVKRYGLVDVNGEKPLQLGAADAMELNTDWTPTFDLNHAAADIWEEKAATVFDEFDYKGGDEDYQRSQQFEHAQKQARMFSARRKPKCWDVNDY